MLLSLVGPAGVWLLGFLLLPISVVSCCRVLLVISSLWLVCFLGSRRYGAGELGAFVRTEQIVCLNHIRSRGEDLFMLWLVFECVCRLHLFVLDGHLVALWESGCSFGFLLVVFPLRSGCFVFVFLSLCLIYDSSQKGNIITQGNLNCQKLNMIKV